MTSQAIIEHVLNDQQINFDDCFFSNRTFLDLESHRHKLKKYWRSSEQLTLIIEEIFENAVYLSPEKRFHWLSLLRVSVEYCLGELNKTTLEQLYLLSFIWSDKKLRNLTKQQLTALQFPCPFDDVYQEPMMLPETDKIVFTSIEKHHLVDYYWQYADKDIAKHCNQPTFENNSSWYEWITKTNRTSHQMDIIEFADWGVIGAVQCDAFYEFALLTFWIGRDFRNQGLAKLALQQWLANRKSMFPEQSIYAEVEQSNIAARRTLGAIGFERILLDIQTPPLNKQFYRYGIPVSQSQTHTEIKQVLNTIQPTVSVRPLMQTTQLYDVIEHKISSSTVKK